MLFPYYFSTGARAEQWVGKATSSEFSPCLKVHPIIWLDRPIGTPLIQSSHMVCCPHSENLGTPNDPKSIQLHIISQAVTNVAMFHYNIATIISISQLSKLCPENLWQLGKKLGYGHTLSQWPQPFYETWDSCEIPLHSFSQSFKFFKYNKNPNEQW